MGNFRPTTAAAAAPASGRVTAGKGAPRPGSPAPFRCFNCGETTHSVRNCPFPIVCGHCSGRHLTRDCPQWEGGKGKGWGSNTAVAQPERARPRAGFCSAERKGWQMSGRLLFSQRSCDCREGGATDVCLCALLGCDRSLAPFPGCILRRCFCTPPCLNLMPCTGLGPTWAACSHLALWHTDQRGDSCLPPPGPSPSCRLISRAPLDGVRVGLGA